jgi:hypothetical protein
MVDQPLPPDVGFFVERALRDWYEIQEQDKAIADANVKRTAAIERLEAKHKAFESEGVDLNALMKIEYDRQMEEWRREQENDKPPPAPPDADNQPLRAGASKDGTTIKQAVLDCLKEADGPVPLLTIRKAYKARTGRDVKAGTLSEIIRRMRRESPPLVELDRNGGGYMLAPVDDAPLLGGASVGA